MMQETVWIVGRFPNSPTSEHWEVMGIWRSEDTARANAKPGEFIGELPVSERFPDETVDWDVEFIEAT